MKHRIRIALPADEQRIRELFLEMLRTIYHTEAVEGYPKGALDRFWNGGEDRVYVAESMDGQVVAFLSVEVHHEAEAYLYLDDFSVAEAYRSQGIGSDLLHMAEAYARELHIPVILLHVEKANQSAFRLYEKHGYSLARDDGNRFLLKKEMRPMYDQKPDHKEGILS